MNDGNKIYFISGMGVMLFAVIIVSWIFAGLGVASEWLLASTLTYLIVSSALIYSIKSKITIQPTIVQRVKEMN